MSGILSIGVSALLANRQAMDTTGHNIANVNTEGYSRQRVDFATRLPALTGSHFIGSGVEVAQIRRQYDDFIANQMRSSQSVASELDAYFSGASRLDDLLADPDSGLQPAMESFFNALQGLADDPASSAARQVALAEARTLVDRFHYIDGEFNRSRDHLNDQIDFTASEINRIAQSIADLNADVTVAYGVSDSAIPNDLLDQRDQLINDLSKLVDIQVLEQSDGALNVFIGKGQALVMATDAATLSTMPSSLDPSRREVAFNYPFGTQTITDQLSGGRIGGLLRFRDQILDPAQNRVGLIALGMATELNDQHRLGLDLDGLAGTNLFSTGSIQLLEPGTNGSSITVGYDSISNLTGSDYELSYDGTDFHLTRLSDQTTTTLPPGISVVDGLSIDIDATGAVAGDTFLIQPTRNGAESLNLLVNDVRKLAAAGPLQSQPAVDLNGNPTNTGNARVTLPSVSNASGLPLGAPMELVFSNDAGGSGVPGFTLLNGPAAPDDFLPYDPATESAGKIFPNSANPTQFDAFGGMSFTISGMPQELVAGAGDRFIINNNTSGSSDNRNALSLADLQGLDHLLGGNATFGETYSQMVADIGAKTHHAEVNLAAQEGLLERSKAALSEVAGVNLDEEAAKLIQFQQAYQASAQMISVANTLFDTLLSAVRS
ncbi:MAG: flagellar hook-associated protein FlgK [Pseudomonadota bacterium]